VEPTADSGFHNTENTAIATSSVAHESTQVITTVENVQSEIELGERVNHYPRKTWTKVDSMIEKGKRLASTIMPSAFPQYVQFAGSMIAAQAPKMFGLPAVAAAAAYKYYRDHRQDKPRNKERMMYGNPGWSSSIGVGAGWHDGVPLTAEEVLKVESGQEEPPKQPNFRRGRRNAITQDSIAGFDWSRYAKHVNFDIVNDPKQAYYYPYHDYLDSKRGKNKQVEPTPTNHVKPGGHVPDVKPTPKDPHRKKTHLSSIPQGRW